MCYKTPYKTPFEFRRSLLTLACVRCELFCFFLVLFVIVVFTFLFMPLMLIVWFWIHFYWNVTSIVNIWLTNIHNKMVAVMKIQLVDYTLTITKFATAKSYNQRASPQSWTYCVLQLGNEPSAKEKLSFMDIEWFAARWRCMLYESVCREKNQFDSFYTTLSLYWFLLPSKARNTLFEWLRHILNINNYTN